MRFISTRGGAERLSFPESVLQGLAPDGGLLVPEHIPVIYDKERVFDSLAHLGTEVLHPYVEEEFSRGQLASILEGTLSFYTPLYEIEDNIYVLELFHGPTLAFKDVGARFMGRVLPHCSGSEDIVVLVATSGDTGGAVANGLYGLDGVHVVVLYPRGKVSELQEKQFASLGNNVHCFAVNGVFDDCQRLVKQAFKSDHLLQRFNLTTANSINLARWLPQSLYYFWIYNVLREKVVISVPSGNFGNLTAGLLAEQMGLPVDHFIAACNANDTVPRYLAGGEYHPKPSIATVANAMDVGDPSNFERLLHLFGNSHDRISERVSGAAYSDEEILSTIESCYNSSGYLLDPHGACGYRALVEQLEPGQKGVFLATAHPAKFGNVYDSLEMGCTVHPALADLKGETVLSIPVEPDIDQLSALIDDKLSA